MKWFTVKEASELLGVSTYKIKKMMKKEHWIVRRGPRRAYLINSYVVYEKAVKLRRFEGLKNDDATWADFKCWMSQYMGLIIAALRMKTIMNRRVTENIQTEG